MNPDVSVTSDPASLYLDMLKRILTRTGFEESYRGIGAPSGPTARLAHNLVRKALATRSLALVHEVPPADHALRADGRDLPGGAETMVGLKRLENLERCVVEVLRDEIPGDLLEAGVWRGGASIFMRAVLKAYGDTARTVWVADSFQGLPKPNPEQYPADAGDPHWQASRLAIGLPEVQANFARYGLLDDQVRFLPGWFHETFPTAPIDELAILRLDGDMYESTIVSLESLYPKVAVGGFVIIDDYGAVPGCRKAVDDYRRTHEITDSIEDIDWTGVYWRRSP